MSSTNRGGLRHTSDYYVTPVSEIVKFLKAFDKIHSPNWERLCILDPCAGGDQGYRKMSYPEALKKVGAFDVDTIDIRDDSLATVKEDYLRIDTEDKYDCIITNPPFSHAKEITTKAISDVKMGGFVIMLLRLNFFGSKGRLSWWNSYRPSAVFIHSTRMSFTLSGTTDSIEYMHCVWTKPLCESGLMYLEVI